MNKRSCFIYPTLLIGTLFITCFSKAVTLGKGVPIEAAIELATKLQSHKSMAYGYSDHRDEYSSHSSYPVYFITDRHVLALVDEPASIQKIEYKSQGESITKDVAPISTLKQLGPYQVVLYDLGEAIKVVNPQKLSPKTKDLLKETLYVLTYGKDRQIQAAYTKGAEKEKKGVIKVPFQTEDIEESESPEPYGFLIGHEDFGCSLVSKKEDSFILLGLGISSDDHHSYFVPLSNEMIQKIKELVPELRTQDNLSDPSTILIDLSQEPEQKEGADNTFPNKNFAEVQPWQAQPMASDPIVYDPSLGLSTAAEPPQQEPLDVSEILNVPLFEDPMDFLASYLNIDTAVELLNLFDHPITWEIGDEVKITPDGTWIVQHPNGHQELRIGLVPPDTKPGESISFKIRNLRYQGEEGSTFFTDRDSFHPTRIYSYGSIEMGYQDIRTYANGWICTTKNCVEIWEHKPPQNFSLLNKERSSRDRYRGGHVTVYPDGRIRSECEWKRAITTRYPDHTEEQTKDGITHIEYNDGSIKWIYLDGSIEIHSKDGKVSFVPGSRPSPSSTSSTIGKLVPLLPSPANTSNGTQPASLEASLGGFPIADSNQPILPNEKRILPADITHVLTYNYTTTYQQLKGNLTHEDFKKLVKPSTHCDGGTVYDYPHGITYAPQGLIFKHSWELYYPTGICLTKPNHQEILTVEKTDRDPSGSKNCIYAKKYMYEIGTIEICNPSKCAIDVFYPDGRLLTIDCKGGLVNLFDTDRKPYRIGNLFDKQHPIFLTWDEKIGLGVVRGFPQPATVPIDRGPLFQTNNSSTPRERALPKDIALVPTFDHWPTYQELKRNLTPEDFKKLLRTNQMSKRTYTTYPHGLTVRKGEGTGKTTERISYDTGLELFRSEPEKVWRVNMAACCDSTCKMYMYENGTIEVCNSDPFQREEDLSLYHINVFYPNGEVLSLNFITRSAELYDKNRKLAKKGYMFARRSKASLEWSETGGLTAVFPPTQPTHPSTTNNRSSQGTTQPIPSTSATNSNLANSTSGSLVASQSGVQSTPTQPLADNLSTTTVLSHLIAPPTETRRRTTNITKVSPYDHTTTYQEVKGNLIPEDFKNLITEYHHPWRSSDSFTSFEGFFYNPHLIYPHGLRYSPEFMQLSYPTGLALSFSESQKDWTAKRVSTRAASFLKHIYEDGTIEICNPPQCAIDVFYPNGKLLRINCKTGLVQLYNAERNHSNEAYLFAKQPTVSLLWNEKTGLAPNFIPTPPCTGNLERTNFTSSTRTVDLISSPITGNSEKHQQVASQNEDVEELSKLVEEQCGQDTIANDASLLLGLSKRKRAPEVNKENTQDKPAKKSKGKGKKHSKKSQNKKVSEEEVSEGELVIDESEED